VSEPRAARFDEKGTLPMSFIDRAKDVAEDVKDRTGDIVGKIGERLPGSVKDTAGDFRDRAGELVEKVKERLGFADEQSDVEVAVSDATDDAANEAKQRATDVAEAAKSAADAATERPADS
jgi:gas vesicle protein